MIKVLFVCHGNICRSPMAEGVFQQMVNQAGLSDQIMTDSAGTSGYHAGETAHRGTQQVLKKHSIPYDGRSRQLTKSDYSEFDYLIAMDMENIQNIQSRRPQGTDPVISLLLDFANDARETEVPDPYYTGGFDYVYDLVTAGCEGLLARIRQDHNL